MWHSCVFVSKPMCAFLMQPSHILLTVTPVQFLGQVFVCTHMPVEFTCISVLFTLVCNVYPYVTLYLVTFMNLYVSRVVFNDGLIDFHYCEKKYIKS